MSGPSLSRLPAVAADVPVIAQINQVAYFSEAVGRFVFTDWPDPSTQYQYFLSRIQARFQNPEANLIKAVDTSSGEIVGFGCLTRIAGGQPENGSGIAAAPPPHMNLELIRHFAAEVNKLEAEVQGVPHFELSSLMVLPQHQGKGIGSRILEFLLAESDKAGLPVYLTSFPAPHNFYLRYGFRDLGYFDTDLRSWAGEFTGFGIYRTYGMLRKRAE